MLFLSELNCMGYWSLDGAWEDYYGGAECMVLYFTTSLTGPFVSMVRLVFGGGSRHAATRSIGTAVAIRVWNSILRLE